MNTMKQRVFKTCVIKANERAEFGEIMDIANTKAMIFMHPAESKSPEHAHDEDRKSVV